MSLSAAVSALRRMLGPLRRRTVLGPLVDAWHLRVILRGIRGDIRDVRVLGPEELAGYIRHLTPLSPSHDVPPTLAFDHIVVRQDQLSGLNATLLAAIRTAYACVRVNRRFALFTPRTVLGTVRPSPSAVSVMQRIDTLISTSAARPPTRVTVARHDRAMLVITFNRPPALARSLPQIAALGCPIVVVDDGSRGAAAADIRRICAASGAELIALPTNRGQATAINVGLSYLLADSRIEWISYFQDDLDVDPRLMDRVRLVEDATERPVLTGYDAEEFATERTVEIQGVAVKLKRSTPGVHLHAHASYFRGILPIPSQYVGAPKRRWESALADDWIVNRAPASGGARGVPFVCIPNLVRTFLWDAADSNWGFPNLPDPPLASAP